MMDFRKFFESKREREMQRKAELSRENNMKDLEEVAKEIQEVADNITYLTNEIKRKHRG